MDGSENRRYNIGMGISHRMTDSRCGKKVALTIRYESDITFPMEMGLLKNFRPTSFTVLQGDGEGIDPCFELDFYETGGSLVTRELELGLDNCSDRDNLILWFANKWTIPHRDLFGYRFVRLNAGNAENFPAAPELRWEPAHHDPNQIFALYSDSDIRCGDNLAVDLIFTPEKLYDRAEITAENPDATVEFLLIAMDGGRLIPFRSGGPLKGHIPVRASAKFRVELDLSGICGNHLSFFLFPYPCLDFAKVGRLERVLYNNSAHWTIAI